MRTSFTALIAVTLHLACDPTHSPSPEPVYVEVKPQPDMATECAQMIFWARDCEYHCPPDFHPAPNFAVIQCFRDHGNLLNFGAGIDPTPVAYTIDFEACGNQKPAARFWKLGKVSQPTEEMLWVDGECKGNYNGYELPPRPYFYAPTEITILPQ